jgi:hypothetical protein
MNLGTNNDNDGGDGPTTKDNLKFMINTPDNEVSQSK